MKLIHSNNKSTRLIKIKYDEGFQRKIDEIFIDFRKDKSMNCHRLETNTSLLIINQKMIFDSMYVDEIVCLDYVFGFQNEKIERLENESKELKFELTEKINQLEKENMELKESMNQQEEIINQTKLQLDSLQNDKNHLEKQIQTNEQTIEELQITISQLNMELNEKVSLKQINFD